MLKDKIIISDIGSTTTKILLLQRVDDIYKIIDYDISPTTVEKPFEDVKIGIYNAVKKLEEKTGYRILRGDENPPFNKGGHGGFLPDYTYLSTSSAGGGLQILVVGMTLVDSVRSAERAVYGIGGVILGTLAIDDNRTSLERLKIITHLSELHLTH